MKVNLSFEWFLPLLVTCSLQAQVFANEPVVNSARFPTTQPITNRQGFVIPSEDVKALRKQGYTDEQIAQATPVQDQPSLTPTPPELKNAVIYLERFMGMTNAMLPADVINMKFESLRFRMNGQDYNYSGHYTVMLSTPRQHKTPYFGFGTPETAKILFLENWGASDLPLQNAIIWEKSNGFIDAVALGKEWIYSGTYTIQN